MDEEINAAFSIRLALLCDRKNLPLHGRQAELARVCCVKPSSVNKWFNARSLPEAQNLLRLAKWGGTTVDYLLSGRGVGLNTEEHNPKIKHILDVAKLMSDHQLEQAVTIMDAIARPIID